MTINMAGIVMDSDLGGEQLIQIQRTEDANKKGRPEVTSKEVMFYGVVTSPNQQEIMRMPAGTLASESIKVITDIEIRDQAVGRQADIIIRKGTAYLAVVINDYALYGFTTALCTMIDLQAAE